MKDGQYRIHLTKEYDPGKLSSQYWNDPVGRATICNTGSTILAIFDLVIGFFPTPDFTDLPAHFVVTPQTLYGFTRAYQSKDILKFITTFLGMITDNKEGFAAWLWQDALDDAGRAVARESAEEFMGIISNVNIVFKLLSFANGPGPLFFDMLWAPPEMNYVITTKNGTITSNVENFAPVANFTISPPAGRVGTNFLFDASESTDDKDDLVQLQMRWDFDSDGEWDTEWSNTSEVNHSYSGGGSYVVTLAVKDKGGLTGVCNHTLNVGGGAGTASHVKLFMDDYPWDSDAMIRMLKALGFNEGIGTKTYEIVTSSNMGSVSMVPGQDLIIIANDQPQAFYNNYATYQVRFTNFVFNGGSLFWEACDQGWNRGSIVDAKIILPGNIKTNFFYDGINTVPDPELPIVYGLPAIMDHNYASHEYFTNLPDGTTIYCLDSNGKPTLIEFNFGAGWIIFTGTTP